MLWVSDCRTGTSRLGAMGGLVSFAESFADMGDFGLWRCGVQIVDSTLGFWLTEYVATCWGLAGFAE